MKWIEKDTKVSGHGKDIIYAKEKYFFAHANQNGVAYSDDLINWNDVIFSSEEIGKIENIAYGNGKFILSGTAGSTVNTYISTSDDGINWKYKKLETGKSFSMHINSCKFINNRFLFFTGYYNYNITTGIKNYSVTQIYETRDGTTINRYDFRYNTNLDMGMMDIEYGNGLYVLVGENGSIFTSYDLSSWTKRESEVNEKLVGITYGKNMFVITGDNGVILTSSDGINWHKQNSNTNSYLIRSRYGNGLYVAVGYNSTILTSFNGIDWTLEQVPFSTGIFYGLVFINNYYVITANSYSSTGTVPIIYSKITRELSYSDDNSLYVFDSNLNFLGVIDEFISLRWRRKYYEAGEMELTVAPYKNNINLLCKNNILIRKSYVEAAIIDTKEIIDDGKQIELKVSGNFLSYLTKRRIIKKKINYSGNIIDGQKELLRSMTALTSNFEIEPTTLDSDNVVFQCTYKNVYDFEVKLAYLSNIGFRIVPVIENKVFRYENFKGKDRTKNQIKNERYCFSKENSNIEKANIIDTNINKKNYALVGGQGEDENRILTEVMVGNSSGFDLYEVFIDAKSQSAQGLSSTDYSDLLMEYGKSVLKEDTITLEFTGYAKDYKDKWDLGDLVDIDLREWGYENQMRITEIEETLEDGKYNIYPTFGPPLAEKMKLDE